MQNKTTNDMTEPKEILDAAQVKMDKIVAHLIDDLASVRAGRASTNLLNGITVDYYGTPTPVSQVASVTVPDARTVLVQPWEKNMIAPIEKAILVANIGLTPSNNGEHIRLNIPPLTEERRKELVKQIRPTPRQPGSACAPCDATRSSRSKRPRKTVCPRIWPRTEKSPYRN